ncbi:hypothetical protein MTO96_051045, partial [Rhipicephalus appendiculatus]
MRRWLSGQRAPLPVNVPAPQCGKLKKWFEEAVVSQADPCRERNTFVCNASLVPPSWHGTAGK